MAEGSDGLRSCGIDPPIQRRSLRHMHPSFGTVPSKRPMEFGDVQTGARFVPVQGLLRNPPDMKRPQLQSAMAASKSLLVAAALLALSITLWLHRAPQGPSTPARAVLESSPDVQAERSNAKVDQTAGWRRDPAVDAIISAFDGASQPRSDASRDAVTEGARATHSRWRDLRPERGATRVFMTLLAGVNPGLGTIAYSRDLNPRAVALTNEQIDALEIIVSRYFAHLKWVAAQSASARSRDLAECRSAGKLLPIAGWSEDARLRARIDRYLAEESDKGPRSAEMASRATQSRVRMLERLGYILITDPQAEYL